MNEPTDLQLTFVMGRQDLIYNYLDPATADEDEVRHYLFHGDIVLVVDGVDLSARWTWIPILDFAVCMMAATEELRLGASKTSFDFTESSDQIRFSKSTSKLVNVSATHAPGTGSVALATLSDAASQMFNSAYSAACREKPGFVNNPIGRAWFDRYGDK